LGGPLLDDEALRARLHTNFAALEDFARALQAVARTEHHGRPELNRFSLSPGREMDVESLRVTKAVSRTAP